MKKTFRYITPFILSGVLGFQVSAAENSGVASDSNKVRIMINEETIELNLDEDLKELKKLSEELGKLSDEINKNVKPSVSHTIEISPPFTGDAITYHRNKNDKKKRFKFSLLTLDVGINSFIDNTDYNSADAINFVRVPDANRSGRTFDIKNGQSRNVNIWPATFNFDLSGARNQRTYLSVGVPGFQFYSLKYNNSIQFKEGMDPHVIETGENYKKNKLGITYLSIPVSLTGQSRITKSKWLTYGIGVIGGYRIASWTNQKTNADGKVKVKDPFNLNDYQFALTGELGVKGIMRLYATYNLTNMWENSLDQNLFAVGIRFFGI